ncbi:hypothetical protein K443DRAFT_99800, partial [Laccaria amethystina LaAM-08-1]
KLLTDSLMNESFLHLLCDKGRSMGFDNMFANCSRGPYLQNDELTLVLFDHWHLAKHYFETERMLTGLSTHIQRRRAIS